MSIIRTVKKSDAKQMLTLWNQCLPHDPLSPEKLKQFFESPHINLNNAFVAEQEHHIVGFLPTAIRNNGVDPEMGWILSFVLRPDLYGSGIEDQLLDHAISHLQSQNKTTISVGNFHPFRFFPHFDARHAQPIQFLENRNFKRLRELSDVRKSLIDFQTPEWVIETERNLAQQDNILFDYCHPQYRADFLIFIKETFWENWYLKNKAYVDNNGDPTDRILALENNRVVGFVNYHAQGKEGYLSQTGVSKSLRGKKVGSVLVFKAIEELIKRGANNLSIEWCPLNFYKIVGGTVTRTRVHLQRMLTT